MTNKNKEMGIETSQSARKQTVVITQKVSLYEMATYILQNTHDGDMLAPHHLKLVEMGINQHLNKEGIKALEDLYDSVLNGYEKPWLHGIKHMTKDLQGFIYWRGVNVDHYSFDTVKSEKASAVKLGETCREVERRGYVADFTNCYFFRNGEKLRKEIKLTQYTRAFVRWYRYKFKYSVKHQIKKAGSAVKLGKGTNV